MTRVPTTDAAIEQRGALRGTLRMPGDKSVSRTGRCCSPRSPTAPAG